MDQDRGSEKSEGKPGRGWTARLTGPIRYRRFTDSDAGGRPSIIFKFEKNPGSDTELSQEVWEVLQSMKKMDRGPEHGGGQHHTGLAFTRDKKHGRVWRLPDNQTGRTAADIIDARLSDLADKMEQEPGKGR